MESGDQAMLVMRRLVPAIPAFIAISANSPFWRGHRTGHAAYRQRILATTPNYGLPTVFETWRNFSDFYDVARRAGVVRHFKDIHWDIRPHPDFGTLEIRVMDSASNLRMLHGLVAFDELVSQMDTSHLDTRAAYLSDNNNGRYVLRMSTSLMIVDFRPGGSLN